MLKIAQTFNIKLNRSKHNNREYWCIEILSLAKLEILINYLNNYPLYSSKYNDYKD